jgi:hypothetical protein
MKTMTHYPHTTCLPTTSPLSVRITPLSATVTMILSARLSLPYPFVFFYFWCCRGKCVKCRQYSIRVILCSADVDGSNTWTVIMKVTNKMQLYRLIYFSLSSLHVSGDIFAHHQEQLIVLTVSGSIHPGCCRLVSWVRWNCSTCRAH